MVTVRKAIKFPLYVATMMRENNQKNVIIVRPLCELGRLSPPVKKQHCSEHNFAIEHACSIGVNGLRRKFLVNKLRIFH